jgi:hypothetical protein
MSVLVGWCVECMSVDVLSEDVLNCVDMLVCWCDDVLMLMCWCWRRSWLTGYESRVKNLRKNWDFSAEKWKNCEQRNEEGSDFVVRSQAWNPGTSKWKASKKSQNTPALRGGNEDPPCKCSSHEIVGSTGRFSQTQTRDNWKFAQNSISNTPRLCSINHFARSWPILSLSASTPPFLTDRGGGWCFAC